jgi:hypothetical protein
MPLPCSPVEPSSQQSLLQAFLLQGCWAGAAIPALSSRLVYLQFHEGFPSPRFSAQGALPSLLPGFLLLLFIIQLVFFCFFPGWGSVCPGGYVDLAQGCLWEYCMTLSSPGGLLLSSWWELASGGVGALLVSPFTMEWRCYAWAGGVEGSEELEFYLFLVVFPARCTSSVSPRFYFRKHAFCFLPLVAILESLFSFLRQNLDMYPGLALNSLCSPGWL